MASCLPALNSVRKATDQLAFPLTPAPFARALTERKYEDPTPVQLAVLEAKAEGRDVDTAIMEASRG